MAKRERKWNIKGDDAPPIHISGCATVLWSTSSPIPISSKIKYAIIHNVRSATDVTKVPISEHIFTLQALLLTGVLAPKV